MSPKIQFVCYQKLLTLGLYLELYVPVKYMDFFAIKVAGAQSLHSEII
jgi:hypothetical protein